jgi:hypothetical protein
MTRLALHGLAGSALLLLASLAGVACGPSFQAVYEGELHFEHCYALDQMNVGDEAKKDCWREWLRGYTYGQSNDRVEYAATRFSELSLDPTLPSEDTRDAGPRRPRRPESTVAAPMPTNAFAPPPNMSASEVRDPAGASGAAKTTVDAGRPARVSSVQLVPGAECLSTCEARWSGCREGCKAGACDACDKTYRTCAPTCFREDAGAPRGR